MKVIQVKAKVASPKIYTQEQMDSVTAELASSRSQVMGLKQKCAQLEADFNIEKKNHALATAGVQMWQRIAKENECDARNWKARADSAAKAKTEDSILYMKATNDLAARLIKAMDAADAARAEAAELNVELMERDARIDELERRIEWLQTHSNTEADFVS